MDYDLEDDDSSSDSNFHESDYDLKDDDDQIFEINVDLEIERDMSGVNYSLVFGLGIVVCTEGVDGVKINKELDYENSDLCTVLMILMTHLKNHLEGFLSLTPKQIWKPLS